MLTRMAPDFGARSITPGRLQPGVECYLRIHSLQLKCGRTFAVPKIHGADDVLVRRRGESKQLHLNIPL